MTWLRLLAPQWECLTYPWDQAEQDYALDPTTLGGWEPFGTDRLQDGTTLVYLRRRVPFLERLRRHFEARAHARDDAAANDHDDVPAVRPPDEADDPEPRGRDGAL